jgi:hypothetical protein
MRASTFDAQSYADRWFRAFVSASLRSSAIVAAATSREKCRLTLSRPPAASRSHSA